MKYLLCLLFLLGSVITGLGQDEEVLFTLSQTAANRNSIAVIEFKALNFNQILAFQGSFQWEKDLLKLDSLGSFAIDGLNNASFAYKESDSHMIASVAWDQPQADPISINEAIPLFKMYFSCTGEIGQQVAVASSNDPTPWLVIQQMDDQYFERQPVLEDGSVDFIENLNELTIEKIDPTCFNILDGAIEVIPQGGFGEYSYKWNVDGLEGGSLVDLAEGAYAVTVVDQLGDSVSTEISLIAPDEIKIANIQLQPTSCEDRLATFTLDIEGGIGEYSFFIDSNEVVSSPIEIEAGTRHLIIEDSNGCAIDSLLSVPDPENCDKINAPNILTPNNDGVNEFLEFDNIESSVIRALTVFDRWGRTLYEDLEYDNDWAGTENGQALPTGDYYYVFRYDDKVIKSYITVLHE